MTYEQINFTIPNYYGLANSSVSTTRSCSRPIGSHSLHFAGISHCRLSNNYTLIQYLEHIAKLQVIQDPIRPPCKGVSYG